ncbi:hypothetical protein TRVL_08719 [Trypanosoma vivax]|nr:hypothetical protein TRVL_08719 [Trypanosoma vivax]
MQNAQGQRRKRHPSVLWLPLLHKRTNVEDATLCMHGLRHVDKIVIHDKTYFRVVHCLYQDAHAASAKCLVTPMDSNSRFNRCYARKYHHPLLHPVIEEP